MSDSPLQRPVSVDLEQAIASAIQAIPSDRTGAATVGVSKTGIEARVGWKPKPNVWFGGYAVKQWGGQGWQAAAQAGVVWGKR